MSRALLSSMPRHAHGMSLIEVMVSVLVLAVGLLGVAAMQSLALRGGQGSLESSQAVMATSSIIESMRANSANAPSYVYDGTGSCATVPGAGSSLRDRDLNSWVTDLKNTLGSGALIDTTTCGKIDNLGAGTYQVTVQWDDRRAGGTSTRSLSVVAQI